MLCQLSYRGIIDETLIVGYQNKIKIVTDTHQKYNAEGERNKKRDSMSGNRTRGVCVTGRNVTNYTNTQSLQLGSNSRPYAY